MPSLSQMLLKWKKKQAKYLPAMFFFFTVANQEKEETSEKWRAIHERNIIEGIVFEKSLPFSKEKNKSC